MIYKINFELNIFNYLHENIKIFKNKIKKLNFYIDKSKFICYDIFNKKNPEKGVVVLNYKMPGECCVCGGKLKIKLLKCEKCGSELSGNFKGCEFCSLSPENIAFLKTFLRCRGSIKDVEKELGISYPTVKNNLEKLIVALELDESSDTGIEKTSQYEGLTRSEILRMLSEKKITVETAKLLLERNIK